MFILYAIMRAFLLLETNEFAGLKQISEIKTPEIKISVRYINFNSGDSRLSPTSYRTMTWPHLYDVVSTVLYLQVTLKIIQYMLDLHTNLKRRINNISIMGQIMNYSAMRQGGIL